MTSIILVKQVVGVKVSFSLTKPNLIISIFFRALRLEPGKKLWLIAVVATVYKHPMGMGPKKGTL